MVSHIAHRYIKIKQTQDTMRISVNYTTERECYVLVNNGNIKTKTAAVDLRS